MSGKETDILRRKELQEKIERGGETIRTTEEIKKDVKWEKRLEVSAVFFEVLMFILEAFF